MIMPMVRFRVTTEKSVEEIEAGFFRDSDDYQWVDFVHRDGTGEHQFTRMRASSILRIDAVR